MRQRLSTKHTWRVKMKTVPMLLQYAFVAPLAGGQWNAAGHQESAECFCQ